MRETSKRRLRGLSQTARRACNPLAIERLEGRLTLSHTPLAPINDFESFDAHPYGFRSGPGPEADSAYYGTMQTSTISNAGTTFVSTRSIVTEESPAPAPMDMGTFGTYAPPMLHMAEPVSTMSSSSSSSSSPMSASTSYGGTALTALQPSVQLALVVPTAAQFDPFLVVIVDHSIVGLMPAHINSSAYSPMSFGMHPYSNDASPEYGGDNYAHLDGNSAPPKPGGDGPGRGMVPPAAYGALPQVGNPHSPGESTGPSDNGVAGRISAALGAGSTSHFVIQVLPNLTMPSDQQHLGAMAPTYGMLLPPADLGAPQRDPGAPADSTDAATEPQSTAANATGEVAEHAVAAVSSPTADVARTAAMLEGIGLQIDAVDQALEGALAEIERLGGDLVSWLGEFGLGSWAAPGSAAVALSAGAYVGLRSARRSTDDEHEEESSSWLFSRLQTTVGPT